MRILATLATISLLAISATTPATAGMMGHGKTDCFPTGCHDR